VTETGERRLTADKVDGDDVFAAFLDDDVGRHLGRRNVAIVGGLDEGQILLEDAVQLASALGDVALD